MKSRPISTQKVPSYNSRFTDSSRSPLPQGEDGRKSPDIDNKSHVTEELDKLDLAIEEMLKMVYYVKDRLAPVLSNVEPNNAKISSGPVSSSPLVFTLAGLREKLESAHNVLEDTASRLDI